MKPDKTTDPSQMFDRLVRNALDFLERSAEELERAPNHSAIDFCTAIELFLKARLLSEHWTLVYDNLNTALRDKKKPTLTKFRHGDFVSVGMKEAILRLRELLNLNISKEAENTFVCISQHRNKLIHFFHPSFSQSPDVIEIASVVVEQLRGWYYLKPLLTDSWRDIFAKYLSDIEKVDSLLREKRAFLQVVYEFRLPAIERLKQEGVFVFAACWFCDFEAMSARQLAGPVLSVMCMVCDTVIACLPVKCPSCGEIVPVPATRTEPHCHRCSKSITLNDLLDEYAPLHLAEGAMERNRAFCGDLRCVQDSEQESAVLFGNTWVCLHCFEGRNEVWTCQSCNHLFLADEEGPLCIACEYAQDEQQLEWPSTSGGVM